MVWNSPWVQFCGIGADVDGDASPTSWMPGCYGLEGVPLGV